MSDGPALGRRGLIGGAVVLAMMGDAAAALAAEGTPYGTIGRITAKPGQRDALAALVGQGTGSMPGCLSYVVAKDLADLDTLWITEIWTSEAAHQASLDLPAVRDAIVRARPLIDSYESIAKTRPLSGIRP